MADAVAGFGTLIQMGDGADPGPEVFTTIAEVQDIGGPGMETGTIDVTHQTSPGAVREFIAGLMDGGEVTFSVNWLPGDATHDASTGLIAAQLARAIKSFKIVWAQFTPDELCLFDGLVTRVSPTSPVDGKLSADVTIKVSGLPSFETAA